MEPDLQGGEGSSPRIVFMGTPSFGAIVLKGLFRDGWNVVGAVTQMKLVYEDTLAAVAQR